MASIRRTALAARQFAANLNSVKSAVPSNGVRCAVSGQSHIQRRFTSQPTQSVPSSENPTKESKPPPYAKGEVVGDQRFNQFELGGKVFVVTGGGQGLGLTLAEGLVEAGGTVHVLDCKPEPDAGFRRATERGNPEYGGGPHYHNVNVADASALRESIENIASEKQRLDGLIAAAAIQYVSPAIDYPPEEIEKMLAVNYTGVFLSARECARQMHKYKIQGSICFIASMSGLFANKGFIAPVYNSSKAAVIQLARNLAMEWGRVKPDGSGGIRVNCISPGHILTPMVMKNFERGEADRKAWEENSMLGRISEPEEYKAAALFILSHASSFMTGQNLVIDGGTSAW